MTGLGTPPHGGGGPERGGPPGVHTADPAGAEAPSTPVYEFLAVLIAWRRLIISFAIGVTLASVIYAFIARPVYVARSTLLPRQDEGQLPGLGALVSHDLGAFAGVLGGASSDTDLLLTILESRTLRERLVKRLGLVEAFGVTIPDSLRARETALGRLEKSTRVGLTKRLSVFVEARAGTPDLAASLANAHFEELDRLNTEFAFTSARQTRQFIEERLVETRDSLSTSTTRLAEFQRSHRMVAIDEQARAAVDVASRLQAELIGLRAQLEVQRRYSTGSYSRTRDLEFRIVALEGRLASLLGAGSGKLEESESSESLLMSFDEIPGLGRLLAELMLEVRTQEAVFMLLTTQYQQAKIEEARDVPTIQVLDRAEPPVFRHAPRRKRIVLYGLLGGLAGGVLLAFACEGLTRALAHPSGFRLRQILGRPVGALSGWLGRTRA